MNELESPLDKRTPTVEIPADLVLEAQAGDDAAVVEVWTGVRPVVEQAIRPWVSDPDRLEEFVAFALERILAKGIYGQNFTGGNFAAWARTVARNTTINEFARKWQSEICMEPYVLGCAVEGSAADTVEGPDGTIDASTEARIAAVFEAAGVSAEARKAFVMLYVHEMSVAAIATALDIPKGTVFSRLDRTKRAIRKRYGISESTHPWNFFDNSNDIPDQKAA